MFGDGHPKPGVGQSPPRGPSDTVDVLQDDLRGALPDGARRWTARAWVGWGADEGDPPGEECRSPRRAPWKPVWGV